MNASDLTFVAFILIVIMFCCGLSYFLGRETMRGQGANNSIVERLIEIMAKLSELAGLLTIIGDKLDKAKAEILSAIEALRQNDPDISPEGQAQIARLQAVADALDAVVPDA